MVEYSGEIFMRVYKGNSCVYIWGKFLCALTCVNFSCAKIIQKLFSDIAPQNPKKLRENGNCTSFYYIKRFLFPRKHRNGFRLL